MHREAAVGSEALVLQTWLLFDYTSWVMTKFWMRPQSLILQNDNWKASF
jgi:hypothetical protein